MSAPGIGWGGRATTLHLVETQLRLECKGVDADGLLVRIPGPDPDDMLRDLDPGKRLPQHAAFGVIKDGRIRLAVRLVA